MQSKSCTGFSKIIQTENTDEEKVMEYHIVPSEKTLWYYHILFSETFEVLKGALEVGKNKQVHQLKRADVATIKPNEKHYFHNISNDDCLLKVTVSLRNKNFVNALLILKKLVKDGFQVYREFLKII